MLFLIKVAFLHQKLGKNYLMLSLIRLGILHSSNGRESAINRALNGSTYPSLKANAFFSLQKNSCLETQQFILWIGNTI
jgi:hypothetical protein